MKLSLKFWLNQLDRRIVHSAPALRIASSLRSASVSPRPESRTSRRAPFATARPANSSTTSAAPGTARSG